jgi:metallo-beta-lactamase family protein
MTNLSGKNSIQFLGATGNVTGSRFLLKACGKNILIDCGLYQERDLRDRNWDPFPFEPSKIDYVVLTHAHLDHCGYLPRLSAQGFGGRIFCTTATAEIAKIVMLDCGHLNEEDARYKRKRHKRGGHTPPRPVEPLYTVEDAEAAFPQFNPVKYEAPVSIADGITATFYDAGHILGSSCVKFELENGSKTTTLLCSGDLGRPDKPILRDPTTFDAADYILVESTYGNRVHEEITDTKEKLADVINSTIAAGGNIVVPSFAIERSQELLYLLNELLLEKKIPHLLAFLDSPMAIRVTEVFKKHPELFDEETVELLNNHNSPFNFPGLTMAMATSQSKAINNIRGTIMVIAGSGMCTGGRIKHHLVNNITRPESTLLFVGYQAYGTLGRTITDGEKEVRILGQTYPVKARVERLYGFSAHADRDELIGWLGKLTQPPKNIFVVHGEEDASAALKDYIGEKTGFPAIVPVYGDEITLD